MMRFVVAAALVVAACGDNLPAAPPPDGGALTASCTPAEPGLLEPVWIAGGAGAAAEVGGFGKPDAILIDPTTGFLLAGDEEPGYQEIHVFDVEGVGGPPEPLGDMPDLDGVSGLAADAEAGLLYVVEQGADRVRRMRPAEVADEPPFYVDDGTVGAAADDPDDPDDGTFVRPQAARVDRLGRLYVSDDARGQAPGARRDVQIFSRAGDYVGVLGEDLGEPENFALDQARDRVYVCDELTREVVVHRYSDGAPMARFGGFRGIPNGIDVDRHGFIYVMDEGDEEVSQVRLFDPDTFEERWSFGARSEPDDLTPGAFHSADTLIIDAERELLLVADQGHDRVQAFSLGEIQGRACVADASLWTPAAVRLGQPIPMRALRFGPDGAVDRGRLREQVRLRARRVDDGSDVDLGADPFELRAGAGVTRRVPLTDAPGDIEITVSLGGLEARTRVALTDENGPPGVMTISGERVIAAGDRLALAPGATLLLAPGARLVVEGELDAAGSEARPVHLTALDADAPWGQIVVRGGGRATLAHAFVDGGGDAERIGHCCPPMMRVDGGRLDVDDSVVTGSTAKGIVVQEGGHLAIHRSVIAHLGMGVEADRSPAEITSSWLIDFRGADDNDALYLRGDEVDYLVEDSVLAEVDDDGLDTLDSSPAVRRCMIYGAVDKALSLDAGSPIVEDTLVADAPLGISFKNIRTASSSALVRRTTVADASDACVDLFMADDAVVRPRFEQVVVWDCGAAFRTPYDPADLTVEDSVVEGLLPGMEVAGTVLEDPLFLEPRRDYRTHPLSPARTPAGDAGWPGP